MKTWLTQILVRQAAMHYRREQRHRASRLDRFDPAKPVASSGERRDDLRMDLRGAILALNPEHREVILLRELQGMTYDEIAAALGVPRGTVESRLFRARRELQELLKEYLR